LVSELLVLESVLFVVFELVLVLVAQLPTPITATEKGKDTTNENGKSLLDIQTTSEKVGMSAEKGKFRSTFQNSVQEPEMWKHMRKSIPALFPHSDTSCKMFLGAQPIKLLKFQ
jgi:hypothetical protein